VFCPEEGEYSQTAFCQEEGECFLITNEVLPGRGCMLTNGVLSGRGCMNIFFINTMKKIYFCRNNVTSTVDLDPRKENI